MASELRRVPIYLSLNRPDLLFGCERPLILVSGNVGTMPWETPLEKVKNSLTGPVAMIISLLGVAVAGVSLIFGAEFSDFTRRLIMLVLVIGLLVSASSILTTLFGMSGALVR